MKMTNQTPAGCLCVELVDSLTQTASLPSGMRFVGLGIDDDTPDSTTFCRFRNELLGQRICENLFARILQQFNTQGLQCKEGVIVDATVIESSRRPRKVIDCAVFDAFLMKSGHFSS